MEKKAFSASNAAKNPALTAFVIAMALVCAASLTLFYLGSRQVDDNEVDDAGITFSFARNLAQGYGIVLYPGGERVEGYSNAGWMFALSAAIKFGAEPFLASKLLAYLLGACTLILLSLMALRSAPDNPSWPMLAAPILLASHATFLIWCFSGMETALQVFLMTAGAYRLIKESDPEQKRLLPIAPLFFFLLAITRPEAIGYFAFAVGYYAIERNIRGQTFGLVDLIWPAAFLVPWGAYQIWHYIYFAWPLPNTYYAKVHEYRSLSEIVSTATDGGQYLLGYLHTFKLMPLFFIAPFALLSRRGWPTALFFTGMLGYAMFFPLYANGDWMDGYRLCAPIAMPLFVLAAMGVQGAANVAGWFFREKPLAKTGISAGLAALFLAGALFWLMPASHAQIEKQMKRPPARVRGIARRAEFYREQLDKLRFQDYEATILDQDMGGLSLTSRMKIIDVGRLCDVPFAHKDQDPKNRKRFAEQYVLSERRPEIVHLRRRWGRATGLLGNPNFHAKYLELPDSGLFGPGKSGNFIRRDLVFVERPENADAPTVVGPGLSLLASFFEAGTVAPGDTAYLRLIWQRDSEQPLPDLRLKLIIEEQDGALQIIKHYDPVMGWLPTSRWEQGLPIGEWLPLPLSKMWSEGTYSVLLKVDGPGEWAMTESILLSEKLTVNKKLKKEKMSAFFENAAKLAGDGKMEAAINEYRKLKSFRGEPLPLNLRRKFETSLCKTAIEQAEPLMQSDPERAALLLVTARERFPRNEKINALLWKLSEAEYAKGMAELDKQNPCAGYSHFNLAATRQPQNAWARRRAEQARPYCF